MVETTKGRETAAVAILFLVTSWVSVMLRVYVRGVMSKSFGIDDILAVVTLFLFTFYCSFVLDGVHYGTGQHILTLPIPDIIISLKAWLIGEIGYVSCTTVLKISIGFFLLRVCVKKFQKVIIWVVISTVTVYSVFYFFLIIFQCHPVSYFWNRFDGHHKGSCVGASVVSGSTYAHSALSVWADWTLALLPISLVWDLDMNPRTKVSLAIILALGALGSAATIVRIPYIHQLNATNDFLYNNVDVAIWSTVEPGIGLTACSIATLKPLFKTFFARSRLIGSSNKRVSSQAWPHPQSSRNGYFRSGGKSGDGVEELGLRHLRYDLTTGGGNSTTIQSMNDPRHINHRSMDGDEKFTPDYNNENSKRFKRFGSGSSKILHGAATPGIWDSTESYAAPDSSSETSTFHGGVKKTSEVSTIKE